MSRFQPPFCPHDDCPSRRGRRSFLWIRRGTYPRKCDGRRAQRFFCKICRRSFSGQHFRLDHRLHLPRLHLDLFPLLVAKVTHRQAARTLRVDRKTVAHRLRLLGPHCQDLHALMLARCPGLHGTFQLDELETYEEDRRLKPLTVPVLIEGKSFFVVHLAVGTLPARGGLRPRDRERKEALEKAEGKRRSESRAVVTECFRVLGRHLQPEVFVDVQTDKKLSYRKILRQAVGKQLAGHQRVSSREPRTPANLLFPINLTLAMLRDGVSRLVRRNWAASKRRARLLDHLWVWVLYRNYIRPRTVRGGERTPAVTLGVCNRDWQPAELLRWKVEILGLRLH